MSAVALLKDAIKRGVPDPLLFQVSPHVVRWYAKTVTWYTCGRHYEAPIDPFHLIEIDPQSVDRRMPIKGQSWHRYPNSICEVIDGNWENKALRLEDYNIYNALESRFIRDQPWEETKFYSRVSNELRQGNTKWGCESMLDFKERLSNLEQLYESIQVNGYNHQKELRNETRSNPGFRRIHKFWPPEFHEVTVNIDRNGELILHDGRHRLIIARLLGVNSIPVRVKVRHFEWQQVRDQVYTGNTEGGGNVREHPDLLVPQDNI